MSRKYETTEMCFYSMMALPLWMEYVTNEEVLRISGNGKNICASDQEEKVGISGHAMRKKGLGELATHTISS